MAIKRRWNAGKGAKKHYPTRAAFNLAVLFLILLTTIIPFETAFAQSTTDATASSDATTSGTSSLGTDQSTTNSSSAAPAATESKPTPESTDQSSGTGNTSVPTSATTPTTETNPSTPSSPTPATAPSAPPPSGSGGPDIQPVVYNSFDQTQVKVDQNTGVLDTTYPITIPPGRNGLQPNLDLVYNSEDSEQGSIFGEGWSISIPYIERLNKSGVDQLYSTSTLNYFTSSLDGELVSTTTVSSTGATYVARTENGTFDKYTFASSTDSWTMTDKNGTQYVFGLASSSEQSDPNNAAHVYKWMLQQMTDTNGNNVTYSYFKNSGQIYPSSTTYTNTTSTTGIFQVNFILASSTDNSTSTATGFAVSSNYRVSEI
jgi:hypothetical protein